MVVQVSIVGSTIAAPEGSCLPQTFQRVRVTVWRRYRGADALSLREHRHQDKGWRGMWNVVAHVLPPILTFPHEGGRDITPLAVLLSAYPDAHALRERG